ncbi:protein Shroom4 isoform X2 [Betta splendens]|uniref:Protein Shroom4 isoform X2 n=1 Tax=Betta splendens TaxID=158456 RepID=A0A6P7LEY9_BETSP|nr:protein Shroom4 isoform X2 [Betta splendens]
METVEQLVSFHHIQVQLSGGAPWGFTLKGGLEHGEPLIITKIEDGGKAALCKKLKVGDELININGSALYGSRQEALILIKGSYRILKLTVRRRSVPLIRPHSWHLAKLSELPLPPPPPPPSPPPPLAGPTATDSPPFPPPPPPSAMQLHPSPYTLPWHTSDTSDLSMQWAQLSRPYSSTDRSSSLGSMESLDTPTPATQPYSDSHNSPVDPTLFNNKRDSAYSSFSASSNTSDYTTVALRPGESCSMDNLLQSLGPACRGYPGGDASNLGGSSGEVLDEAQAILHKSRSLTRPRPKPVEVKERPSSCCYEKEPRGGDYEIIRNGRGLERKMNPPQPPTRKDSFRATRGRRNIANKRCSSAPVEISSVPSYCKESDSSLMVESGGQNGFPTPQDGDKVGNFKEDTLDLHYIQRHPKDRHVECDTGANIDHSSETASDELSDQVRTLLIPSPSCLTGPILAETSMEAQEQCQTQSKLKHSSTSLHRHSAPEKLLATQLQLLKFDNDSTSLEPYNQTSNLSGSSMSHSSQCSQSSYQQAKEYQEASQEPLHASSAKWGGSRCSTPGSVFFEEDANDTGERLEGAGVNGGRLSPVQIPHHWGRSVSVPGDSKGLSSQKTLSSDQIAEREFEPLSSAASMDTLLEEQRSVDRESIAGKNEQQVEAGSSLKKSNTSRNHRRNRRRSDRFATNLRNEIQRKKAQLQRSRGPGGLLCSGETVQEEEGPDLHEEGADPDLCTQESHTKAETPSSVCSNVGIAASVEKSSTSRESKHSFDQSQAQSTTYTQNNNLSKSVHVLDPGVPSFGVGIRVVEEPAPAGKARRWRWTPEHKLQPETEPERRCPAPDDKVLGVTGSRHGVCAFTSTSSYSRSSSSSRKDECDILPFADRMKFFEQTSRGMSGPNISSLPSHKQKKPPNPPEHEGELGVHSTQRRYSYQGGLQQESGQFSNSMEARRQSVSTSRERLNEKAREQAREREEWEESLRERERRQEKERQARELEAERMRLLEIQREREREEQVRRWEMERARELELERDKEMEMVREKERLKKEREKEFEKELERRKEELTQLVSHQEFHSTDRHQEFQHKDNFHSFQPRPQVFSHSQAQNQVPRSAFHPVSVTSRPPENQQPLHQGYAVRSYTPTETFPARQQDTTKLNRKYSLTERDWRQEHSSQHQHHRAQWGLGQTDSSSSSSGGRGGPAPAPAPLSHRGRAMSENDLRYVSSQRWSPSVSTATSQTLNELEEGVGGVGGGEAAIGARPDKKRTPPPPRPPPPKWEQFHRRRASHHTLFATPSPSSAASHPQGRYVTHSSSFIPQPEASRQRSYSLPPERQEAPEGCPRCSCSQTHAQERAIAHNLPAHNQAQLQEHHPFYHNHYNQNPAHVQQQPVTAAPPSPRFSRRSFRPVTPTQREELLFLPPPPAESSLSVTDVSHSPEQERAQERDKQHHNVRPGAEWQRAPSPIMHSSTPHLPAADSGDAGGALPSRSYFAIDCEQQQLMDRGFQSVEQHKSQEAGTESETTLSASPAHSLEADLDVPMETDIDDFQEEDLPVKEEAITSELPCFALPVTVLETDMDAVPESEASSSGRTREDSSSVEEELEAAESGRERLSLEELFPHGGEGESGPDGWRGAYTAMEPSTDSLDRRSGASSSCSSYYSTSAGKAQLLSQMKDLADTREKDEDDELTYKQLMESLRKKLGVLREAQRGLQEDIRANAQLGEEVEGMVVSVCKPNEVDKFRMFIGDLDKVVSLLLSLSGRLLRVEATLDALDPETEQDERLPLQEKKRQLMRQLSEAQDLKDHVDRREQAVSRVLGRCLSPEHHRDYSHFVKMKAALLVEQRQLEDKIRLGEEQLRGLRESLGLGLGIGMGMSLGYGHY